MTPLRKPVRRRVEGERRPLVVSLIPNAGGSLLELREHGRRKGYVIPVRALWVILAMREADRLIAEKRAAKKAKRLARKGA